MLPKFGMPIKKLALTAGIVRLLWSSFGFIASRRIATIVSPMAPFAERVASVRERIATCAAAAGRSPAEITLVAVTKTHPAPVVREAIATGLLDLGENRIQEADRKIAEVASDRARWHLIGHLQSNKARRAVALFHIIQSLDSVDLARRLDRICKEEGRPDLPVLIQVHLGDEASKSGVDEAGLEELADVTASCEHLQLKGLMSVPPFFDDVEMVRPFFRKLRGLRDGLQLKGCFGDRPGALSMGMTHDFEIAIAEGATIVRIGTAIFGERETRA